MAPLSSIARCRASATDKSGYAGLNLEATSNENFDEKIDSVCKELGSEFGLETPVMKPSTGFSGFRISV